MSTDELKETLKSLIQENTDKSNDKVIQLLEDCNKKDKLCLYRILYPDGENLLHWACAFNNAKICKYLVDGLHVNLENYRGTTPLYYACMNNAKDSITYMIAKARANPYMRSGFSGSLPLDILKDKDMIELMANYSLLYFYIRIPTSDNKLEFESDDLVLNYKYRKYMFWVMTVLPR